MRIFMLDSRLWHPLSPLLICMAAVVILSSQVTDPSVPVLASADCKPVYSVDTDEPLVAISFDASWGAEYTGQLLDILDSYQVGATFFLVTMWVEQYPDLAREIFDRGYEIGLHSTTHPHFSQLDRTQMENELECNYCSVVQNTGAFPVLFRPPFGDYNSSVTAVVRDCGYEVIQWSVDSLDWMNLSADEIVARVTKDINRGDIILLHNNGLHTAEALPRILDYLQQQGLTACSVSRLLPAGNATVDANGVLHCE